MRSAKQAAMANAGLASGTQIHNARTQQTNKPTLSRSQSRQPQSSGSEARLGDILVSILERLSSLENKVNSLNYDHIFQCIDGLERKFTSIERGNDEAMAHILKEITSLRIAYEEVMYRNQLEEHNDSSVRDTTYLLPANDMRPLTPQTSRAYAVDWGDVGMQRETRSCTPSSVGTNEFGYDGEFMMEMALPTPSEARDIDGIGQESGIYGGSPVQLEEDQVAPESGVHSSDEKKEEQSASREVTIEISGTADV